MIQWAYFKKFQHGAWYFVFVQPDPEPTGENRRQYTTQILVLVIAGVGSCSVCWLPSFASIKGDMERMKVNFKNAVVGAYLYVIMTNKQWRKMLEFCFNIHPQAFQALLVYIIFSLITNITYSTGCSGKNVFFSQFTATSHTSLITKVTLTFLCL